MNPDLQFESLQLQVNQSNEQVFNDEFWDGLNCVINAVDNVKVHIFIITAYLTHFKIRRGSISTEDVSFIKNPCWKAELWEPSATPK